MLIKNVENKIKLAFAVSLLAVVASIVISISAVLISTNMVAESSKNIYVLNDGIPFRASQTDIDINVDIEAKNHVNEFHNLFFTLAPDEKYINYNIQKSMYYIDDSGLKQVNNLKEKGFYSSILASSAVFSIMCDSVKFESSDMSFTYYGTQRIERKTSIIKRELVTSGFLRKVPRTENNPHGLLIVNWKTLRNTDLEQKAKMAI